MFFITKEEDIKIDSPIQALYFYASWMPYHNKFLTMIGKIEEKHKNIFFFAIDADTFRSQTMQRFGVDSLPTVLIFKNGKEIKRIVGLTLTSAFRSAFADICNVEKL